MNCRKYWLLVGGTLLLSLLALPQAVFAGQLDSGDTAWVITATALVLFMTLPGLAMFYAGLVPSKNVLSMYMQCFGITALVTVLWIVFGYSIVFDSTGMAAGERGLHAFIGGFGKVFLRGVTPDALTGTIPEPIFVAFQLTFAIITPALMVGAYVERVKFQAVLILSGVWLIVVYAPVCHWIWGGGWLSALGIMDFAGGLVVHTTAGVSALVIAVMVGGRRGFPNQIHPPHNPGMTAAGAALLWVGWFGFNGGSQLAADGSAGMAIAATHIAAAAAAVTWSATEWIKFGKTSVVGAATGVIAGLATVTPASGFIGPVGALILGVAAGAVCFFATELVKQRWKIDDSLDVFAVHGVGGMLGSLLVAGLAVGALGGNGLAENMTIAKQFGVQVVGLLATAAWSALATFAIVKITAALTGGLRVDEEDELVGLDLAAHGERGYDF
jgi:Amt family ammonium transporter